MPVPVTVVLVVPKAWLPWEKHFGSMSKLSSWHADIIESQHPLQR